MENILSLLAKSLPAMQLEPANGAVASSILAFLVFLYFLWWMLSSYVLTSKKLPPKAAGSWPIIGHLRLLGSEPNYRVFANMADRHGPIFTINIGLHRTLVVSNWELTKECLTTNDKAFASRPNSLANEIFAYDGAIIGFSAYNQLFRMLRKIIIGELISNHRLDVLKDGREAEVRTSLKELNKLWCNNNKGNDQNSVLVDMKTWYGHTSMNVILRYVVGKSGGYSDAGNESGWEQGVKAFLELSGKFVVSDALPFLRFLDLGGHEKAMRKVAKEVDGVVGEWLREHREKRANGEASEDITDVMLKIFGDGKVAADKDPDTMMKATMLGLVLAASDTSWINMTWTLTLLINNPRVLKKAQLELDSVVGKERLVQESDLKDLVYLKAIIMESLRLYPSSPLSLPHESVEDCTVGGYHIPKGTRMFYNIWKIHRDPRVWSNPDEFLPERFLTTHKGYDVRGQTFKYLPFGNGRRMCAGLSFAMRALQLTQATIFQGFDFANPSDRPLDTSEGVSLNLIKEKPLELLIKPRLPSHLYA